MPPTVWIVKFGGWQYKVSVTTLEEVQRRSFIKPAIVYHSEADAIAACNVRNELYQRMKQRHLVAA